MENLSKHIGFVILLCLAFFLLPDTSYACTKKVAKTEQKTCSKDQSSTAEKKDCCKTMSCKKGKHHNDCGGKCKNCSCGCINSVSSLNLHIPLGIVTENYFAEVKKKKFDFSPAYYSSGYFSIWQPPKIG
ncbi:MULTISPECIES: hypothetical protein [unclassified Arcicella]|uniref:hypothetical protein n=1 Tax=unclassified Arcicella TaxID=2644986 RepID=UPI00285A320A|nr:MULTISPECIES: hypothetical protein [unclassified Arcicella]MCA6439183.1 hypothetical protein [Chitinophagaceae bacterium]MCA6447578.1 hypothetical protein [Chitinophagaceae bacterium]MDR6561516.1 hypothetical protein [Arcicella sp. BE51]MDR6811400.1 hypothetical protein [Arcicella sp. BE140]MDR6822750.1 hypothetical protein [Arcicella sp. BE139]